MKLTIQYPVLTKGVPFRTSKERLVLLTDSMEINIPDFSGAEIDEVALMIDRDRRVVTPIRGYEGHIYTEMAPRELVDDKWALTYRLRLPQDGKRIDGFVWSPLEVLYHDTLMQLRFDNGSSVDAKVFPQEAADVVAGRTESNPIGTTQDYRFNALDADPFHNAREIMTTAAADLLLIDGALWRRSHLPVVGLVPQGGTSLERRIVSYANISTVHVPLSQALEFVNRSSFSVTVGALEREDGYRLAEEITRELGGADIRDVNPEVGIEIHDPTYFEDQDATPVWLLHCASKIRTNLCHRLLSRKGPYDNTATDHQRIAANVGEITQDALLLLHALSREIPRTDITGDYANLASLVRQAAEMPEVTPEGLQHDLSRLVLNAAADRWENRPITVPVVGDTFRIS